jgi:hypothetical protein
VVVVGIAREGALDELRIAVTLERGYGGRVERHAAPPPPRLRWAERRLAVHRDELLFDAHAPRGKVGAAPRQADELATAHPGRCGEPPERVEAVAVDVGEETGELLRRPRLDAGALRLREFLEGMAIGCAAMSSSPAA